MNLLITIYSHIEYYPPSLYALTLLQKKFNRIKVCHRNFKPNTWEYPESVSIESIGKRITVKEAEKGSKLYQIFVFFQYILKLVELLKSEKPSWILTYDLQAFVAIVVSKMFIKQNSKIWYHSHDIPENNQLSPKKLQYWLIKVQNSALPQVDLFTLPSEGRLSFFKNYEHLNYHIIPNYPLKNFICKFNSATPPQNRLKLIYHGAINENHGLESFIPILGPFLDSLTIELTLIGWSNSNYINFIKSLATQYKVQKYLHIYEPIDFVQLPTIISSHHVGLAIHLPKTNQYKTGATASNKIYEYMALGMPVILYDDTSYTTVLKEKKWTFFTNLSSQTNRRILTQIVSLFEEISNEAINDFVNDLNYENYFLPILNELN